MDKTSRPNFAPSTNQEQLQRAGASGSNEAIRSKEEEFRESSKGDLIGQLKSDLPEVIWM